MILFLAVHFLNERYPLFRHKAQNHAEKEKV